jgi:branched-chain amino acid transport system permease protein
MSSPELVQIFATGLTNGAVYGLIALGFTLGFLVTRVINFAHGELLMIAILVAISAASVGLPLGIACLVGIAASAVLGAGVYAVAIAPVLRSEVIGFAWLVTTLGTSIAIAALASLIWGGGQRSFPDLIPGGVDVSSVRITGTQMLAVALTLVVVVVFELVRRRTLAGKVMAAVSRDSQMAAACGINRTRVEVIAFAVAGALAGTAGLLIAPIAFANPFMGLGFAIKGFVAIVLGGLGHPGGAVVGAFGLGLSEAFATSQLGGSAADWFPFVLLIGVLVIRPQGLFGVPEKGLTS